MAAYQNPQQHEDDHVVSSHSFDGNVMATRLSEADRRAVDALLDTESPALKHETPQAQLQFQQRVAAVRGWLNLLAAAPAEEPPQGLVAATLKRIEQADRKSVV